MQFEIDAAIALLDRTPLVLRAWLEGLPEAWLAAWQYAGEVGPWRAYLPILTPQS
jgi:hypothetical protein